jgi:hypothetical protein
MLAVEAGLVRGAQLCRTSKAGAAFVEMVVAAVPLGWVESKSPLLAENARSGARGRACGWDGSPAPRP